MSGEYSTFKEADPDFLSSIFYWARQLVRRQGVSCLISVADIRRRYRLYMGTLSTALLTLNCSSQYSHSETQQQQNFHDCMSLASTNHLTDQLINKT